MYAEILTFTCVHNLCKILITIKCSLPQQTPYRYIYKHQAKKKKILFYVYIIKCIVYDMASSKSHTI